MAKFKKYQIKTLQDMFDCVTKDNLDNFMTDLRSVLEIYISFNELSKAIGELKGIPPELAKIESEGYLWIDDGKHENKVTIKARDHV